jgi:hypothetical protein
VDIELHGGYHGAMKFSRWEGIEEGICKDWGTKDADGTYYSPVEVELCMAGL